MTVKMTDPGTARAIGEMDKRVQPRRTRPPPNRLDRGPGPRAGRPTAVFEASSRGKSSVILVGYPQSPVEAPEHFLAQRAVHSYIPFAPLPQLPHTPAARML